MLIRGRIAAALLFSVAGHLALLVWWPAPAAPDIPVPAPVLAVTLVAGPEPVPPAEAEPVVQPEPVARSLDTSSENVRVAEPAPRVVRSEDPAPVLNLDRPDRWESVVDSDLEPAALSDLPFNRALGLQAETQRRSQARKDLLAARQGGVHGATDEEYGRKLDAAGETIKVDGRCFSLRESEFGGASQWWMTGCREPLHNPLTLNQLEFDAVGRVVAD